jgi:hypothetical protein
MIEIRQKEKPFLQPAIFREKAAAHIVDKPRFYRFGDGVLRLPGKSWSVP